MPARGLALIFGNEGQDFIITGPDGKEVFGGTGNDFILGGEGGDFLLGNEGDDWIEAGDGFDTTAGDNSELFFNSSIIGHDVMFAGQNEHDFDAESGDDIMVQGESVMRNEGMLGFDWAIHKGNHGGSRFRPDAPIFTTDRAGYPARPFRPVEALSGWDKNDVLQGRQPRRCRCRGAEPECGAAQSGRRRRLRMAARTDPSGRRPHRRPARVCLATWWHRLAGGRRPGSQIVAFDDGNILLGGGGSDTIEGRGGNDVIDGDRWLNVRIRIKALDGQGSPLLDQNGQQVYYTAETWAGRSIARARSSKASSSPVHRPCSAARRWMYSCSTRP